MISPHLDNSFIYLKTLMPLAPTYLSTTDFPLTLTLSPIGEREKGRNLSLALAHHKLFSLSPRRRGERDGVRGATPEVDSFWAL